MLSRLCDASYFYLSMRISSSKNLKILYVCNENKLTFSNFVVFFPWTQFQTRCVRQPFNWKLSLKIALKQNYADRRLSTGNVQLSNGSTLIQNSSNEYIVYLPRDTSTIYVRHVLALMIGTFFTHISFSLFFYTLIFLKYPNPGCGFFASSALRAQ